MFWGGRSSLPQLRRLHSVGTNNTPAHSRTLQWQQNDWSFVWVECYRCWYHVILTVFLFQHERDLFQLFIAERSNNWKEFPLIDVSVCVIELLEAGRRWWWWRWWWWYLVLLFMLSLLVEIVFFVLAVVPIWPSHPTPVSSHIHILPNARTPLKVKAKKSQDSNRPSEAKVVGKWRPIRERKGSESLHGGRDAWHPAAESRHVASHGVAWCWSSLVERWLWNGWSRCAADHELMWKKEGQPLSGLQNIVYDRHIVEGWLFYTTAGMYKNIYIYIYNPCNVWDKRPILTA